MNGADIVVPCWNAERTIGATIESALSQDQVESIVVVDDGSTDGSLAIARRFEPRVHVVTGPNGGVASARNKGAALGTAGWVVFLDSDDLLLPGTIGLRLAAAAGTGADVIICDWREFDDTDGPAASPSRHRSIDWGMFEKDPELAAATRVWAPPAAILYRRAAVDAIGGFRADVSPIEDARFLFDAAFRGARFAHGQHIGAAYRIAPGSLSRANPARFWTSVLRNGQQVESLWRERGSFGAAHRNGLLGIYNNAARGLFAAAHPAYFEAVDALRRLGLPRPTHSRVATPLARIIGLQAARRVLSAAGKS